MKINADFKAFAAVQFDSTKYIASPTNGISRFMLDRVGNEKARATTIVEYKPNSKFPMHEHFGGDEFLVLEGTFKDQYGEFGSETYVRNPIGSKHSPWVDDDGCTIMVKLLQMAETEGEGVEPLNVHYDGENEDKKSTEWGCRIDMYHNVQTGENVSMCWIDPRQEFPTNGYCEELFVVEGSLFLSTGTEYNKWAWLRFPASKETVPERKGLKAGPNGAQVYRKTGHLSETAMGMEKIQISMDTEEIIP